MIRAATGGIAEDTGGAAAVEFALVLPVLLMTLLGLLDMGFNMYTAQMLQGAVQNAARLSTIEAAELKQATIDDSVTKSVRAISPNASLTFKRTAYASFSSVARPEDFTDVDGNGVCAKGEPFEDMNGNGKWDQDSGTSGFGGARDAVLYVVTVSYPRPFPFLQMLLGAPGKTSTLSAVTVLRNQPYAAKTATTAKMGNCL